MRKKYKFLYYLLLFILLAVFAYSAYRVIDYLLEAHASKEATDTLIKKAVVLKEPTRPTLPQAAEPTEPAQEPDETVDVPEEPPRPLETAPLTVDFQTLWQENTDIVAWIYSADTPIHYPIVQAADNDYYLRRLLNGQYNRAGTLFMDYRNDPEFTDWNTVIYGHNMQNDSMFGTLVKYKDQAYYEAHPVIYLLTPEQDYKLELVAGYVTDAASSIYHFPMTAEYMQEELERSIARSDFVANIEVQPEDRIVTLSTCSYDYNDARYVVIGILRELDRVPENE